MSEQEQNNTERYRHLINSTKKHEGSVKEGESHIIYDDATGEALDTGDVIKGKATIGVGRNVMDRGISDEEAEMLLRNDLENFEIRCKSHLGDLWEGLSGARKNVLVEMAFNMGVSGLLSFKNMLSSIEEQKYDEAAEEMLNSKWASQVGSRANVLSQQMKTGEYQAHK